MRFYILIIHLCESFIVMWLIDVMRLVDSSWTKTLIIYLNFRLGVLLLGLFALLILLTTCWKKNYALVNNFEFRYLTFGRIRMMLVSICTGKVRCLMIDSNGKRTSSPWEFALLGLLSSLSLSLLVPWNSGIGWIMVLSHCTCATCQGNGKD